MIPPKSEISNCSKPHLLQFSLVGYAGADPYLLNLMLIIRGLADSFLADARSKGLHVRPITPRIIRKVQLSELITL